MEKEIVLKTRDKKSIYGTIVGVNSDTLIIFVHGFTGHRNEHLFFNGSKYFSQKGFDVLRFNLYGWMENSRTMLDTSISIHGKDIDFVVNHFRKEYKKIIVAGHSFGGTSLLFTNQNLIDGYIFLDATYVDKDSKEWKVKYNKSAGGHIFNEGLVFIVGKKFIDELRNFPECGELIKNIKKPILLITAGGAGNSKAGKKYFKLANNPKKLVNIEGANHCFDHVEHEAKVFEEIGIWLKNLN